MDRIIEKLKVINATDFGKKFYGYKFYISFEDERGNPYEYLTNNTKLFLCLEENKTYEIEFTPTNERAIAPNTICIMLNMRKPKIIREVAL
jgi:hypothetical protein